MDNKNSFIRWQGITINQLAFTTNLIFTITIAVIGFLVSIITKDSFVLSCVEKYFYTIGFAVLIISFISGIVINLTRLYDYRLTAKTAREEEEADPNSIKLEALRSRTKILGKATWIILWIQLISFGLGILSSVITFFIHYSDKLI